MRYNPNAPLVLDAHVVESMGSANPLNRKRVRDEARRKGKKAAGEMVVDDDEGVGSQSRSGWGAAPLAKSGGLFATLGETSS